MVSFPITFFRICKNNSYHQSSNHLSFLCRNSPEHVQPFVLVRFTGLPFDQTVSIECRAWAKGIEQFAESTTRRGMTTFTLLRSNKSAPAKT